MSPQVQVQVRFRVRKHEAPFSYAEDCINCTQIVQVHGVEVPGYLAVYG